MTYKNTTGFTFIETLLAIFILSVAIAGPLTLASRSLGAALIAKNQTIAYYLGQDAIEYLRYARDTSCLAGGVSPCVAPSWVSTCSSANGGCQVDSTNDTVTATSCEVSGCPMLKYDTGTFRFGYSSGTNSLFKRTIVIAPLNVSGGVTKEFQIVVTVEWKDVGSVTRKVVLQENMFLWQ